jgi:hypothetical protein
MRTLSTGHPSTLGEYKGIARIFGPKPLAFIQEKIDKDPDGEKGEVIVDERQMLMLLASLMED